MMNSISCAGFVPAQYSSLWLLCPTIVLFYPTVTSTIYLLTKLTYTILSHSIRSNVQGRDVLEVSYGHFGMVSPFFVLTSNVILKKG